MIPAIINLMKHKNHKIRYAASCCIDDLINVEGVDKRFYDVVLPAAILMLDDPVP
jgi:hypothetical protein